VIAIVAALLLLVAASMETLSAGRAYVGGEGLWSKAQKDAVHHLLLYARGLDERSYRSYLAAIAVPLGDRKAREALDRPEPDYAAARRGFLEGRNHPDDVEAMATLFVRFRNVGYVDRAIAIWAEGDGHIDRLRDAAGRLHAEIGGPRDPACINRLLEPLEDRFSYTLVPQVRLALDNSGTGLLALHYLKRFPVNVLKIDQAFVKGLPDDRHDAAIARVIVELARGLDLDVVAEGVRLPAQRDFLLGIGCRLCQGDLFGGPAPAREIYQRLRAELAA